MRDASYMEPGPAPDGITEAAARSFEAFGPVATGWLQRLTRDRPVSAHIEVDSTRSSEQGRSADPALGSAKPILARGPFRRDCWALLRHAEICPMDG